MAETPPQPEEQAQDEVSPAFRATAIVMLVVPLLGLAFHAVVYLQFPRELADAYVFGPGLKIVFAIAAANLLSNFFHYRHTRMGMDVASRILTYVWLLTIILMMKVTLATMQ
jgi:hypothetical protein